MRKLAFVVLMLMFGVAVVAQETKETKPPSRSGSFSWAQGAYRLDFVVKEMDEGKVNNSRTYSMVIEATDNRGGGRETIKTGNRIPVTTSVGSGTNQIQYIDVGFNMDAQLFALEDSRLMLESTVEISALATNEPTQNQGAPAIRQIRSATTGEVVVGKANQLASLDDTVSKHRFVIEVTPTKLR